MNWRQEEATEQSLTENLSDELRDACDRVRETAVAMGDQRIYASHKSIMFSRKVCYFFVRPRKNLLEIIFFVGRKIKHPKILKSYAVSKSKTAHMLRIKHRDEFESPITDWIQEAYDMSEVLRAKPTPKKKAKIKSKLKAKIKSLLKSAKKKPSPKKASKKSKKKAAKLVEPATLKPTASSTKVITWSSLQ